MKIAVVIPSFYPAFVYGGTIFSSFNTCKELAKKGHEVQVSTTNTNMYSRLDVPINKWLALENFQVKYYNETKVDKFSLALMIGVWKDIRQADVIHIQAIFNTPTPIALLYAWLLRKPVLLSPRGVMGDWIMKQGSRFKKVWMLLFIKPFANNITWHATADQEKNEILAHFPSTTVAVVPNGIDLSFYSVQPHLSRTQYIASFVSLPIQSEHVIVSMGRLHKKKGFDVLIESMVFVKQQYPDVLLLIAGQDEGELEYLKQLCTRLQLTQTVFFLGAIEGEAKRDLLIHADIFALPSHNENFGNVYAEALAAGLPIVASVHTPWNDVEEFGCGYSVEVNATHTADAILKLLKVDKELVKKNAQSYIKKFSWELIAEKFEAVFDKISRNSHGKYSGK